jgi:hypothetical protein
MEILGQTSVISKKGSLTIPLPKTRYFLINSSISDDLKCTDLTEFKFKIFNVVNDLIGEGVINLKSLVILNDSYMSKIVLYNDTNCNQHINWSSGNGEVKNLSTSNTNSSDILLDEINKSIIKSNANNTANNTANIDRLISVMTDIKKKINDNTNFINNLSTKINTNADNIETNRVGIQTIVNDINSAGNLIELLITVNENKTRSQTNETRINNNRTFLNQNLTKINATNADL